MSSNAAVVAKDSGRAQSWLHVVLPRHCGCIDGCKLTVADTRSRHCSRKAGTATLGSLAQAITLAVFGNSVRSSSSPTKFLHKYSTWRI